MTWHFMQTTACNRKTSLGLPFTIVTLLGTALLTSVIGHFRVPKRLTFKARLSAKPLILKLFLIMMQIKLIFTTKVSHLASFWKWDFLELGNGLLPSSTLNFVISDSGVPESRHSPLRDIHPQSGRLGTEMLGTNACWLHMWPEWFAVPLKCLSNPGRLKETTFGFVSWRQRTTILYRIEERVGENNSDYFWRWPEVFTVSHPMNAWNQASASAAFLVNTLAIS